MERQRLDKWLWHARVVKARTSAAALVESGHVRLNGVREKSPGHAVKAGDVVTIALDRNVRVLKVIGYAERRGSAETVRALYEDLTPPPAPRTEAISGEREEGSGRPTKRERREIDRLQGRDELD